ncbi:unnamed protein product, partial [marine sediment metagenome]
HRPPQDEIDEDEVEHTKYEDDTIKNTPSTDQNDALKKAVGMPTDEPPPSDKGSVKTDKRKSVRKSKK